MAASSNSVTLSRDDMRALVGGSLEALRNSRTALGILLVTFKIPANLASAKAALAAGVSYQTQTKANKGHGLGAPSYMAWSGFAFGLLEDATSKSADPDVLAAAQNLQIHVDAITAPIMLASVVEHCHIRQAHQDGGDIIIASIAVKPNAAQLLQNAITVLRAHGVSPEEGCAPPGPNERRLRKMAARFNNAK